MNSAIYAGTVTHHRSIPKTHHFRAPVSLFYFNLDEIQTLPQWGIWFSAKRWALSQFKREDYYGDGSEPLAHSIRNRMQELTGHSVEGEVYGLVNLRTLGLYFSPVNFYFGYDSSGKFTHFLAEVSNIPWNERHQYCQYVADGDFSPATQKKFKVSPFNPIEQKYRWQITPPGRAINIGLSVSDERGKVFYAQLDLKQTPFSKKRLRGLLMRKPAITISIVAGIYWQALKLFIKGVPYIPYEKEIS